MFLFITYRVILITKHRCVIKVGLQLIYLDVPYTTTSYNKNIRIDLFHTGVKKFFLIFVIFYNKFKQIG